MKAAYIVIGTLIYSILGCHNVEKTPLMGTAAPTAEEVAQLRAINAAQADTLAAVKAAFGASAAIVAPNAKLTDARSDKMAAMVKLIQDGGKCVQTNTPADENYQKSWSSLWQVNGSGCPVAVSEAAAYSLDKATYSFTRTVSVSSAFQAASGLGGVRVKGSLGPGPNYAGKSTVVGSFQYDNLVVGGVGSLGASISVTPLDGSSGEIKLRLLTPTQIANVRVLWNLTEHRIFVNESEELDDKTLNDLFSSFQLLELLDRVKKMM